MLDGRPLIDVHLHAARLPTLKPSWTQWAHDFGDREVLDRVYDGAGTMVPAEFDAYLAGEGVDTALVLAEYQPQGDRHPARRGPAARSGTQTQTDAIILRAGLGRREGCRHRLARGLRLAARGSPGAALVPGPARQPDRERSGGRRDPARPVPLQPCRPHPLGRRRHHDPVCRST